MQVVDRIGRRIKLHDLHVLLAVAQVGSMSKAAVLLNTGQPAISRSIADLEHALGVRLLNRTRQGVIPTKFGRALLDGGTRIFDNLRETIKTVEYLSDPTAGQIRVGGNPFLTTTFVAAAIDRLSRRYARVVTQVVTGSVRALHHELAERTVDLLITRRFGPIAEDSIHFEKLFEDSYSVVVSADHALARRRRVDLRELMSEQWVLPPPDGPLGSVARDAFRASGVDYPHTAVIGPAEVRVGLLSTGRFISILPNSGLRFASRQTALKVLPVEYPFRAIEVGIATLKNRPASPVAMLFIERCRELVAPLVKNSGR